MTKPNAVLLASSLCLAASAVATAALADAEQATGRGYQPIPLNHSIIRRAEEPFQSFIDRLMTLHSSGKLKADSGDPEAKRWLLEQIAKDFHCERDFGGVCRSDSTLDAQKAFLRKLSDLDWPDIEKLESIDDLDLNKTGFQLGELAPLNNRVNADPGGVCFPGIARLANEQQYQQVIEMFGGDHYLLEALSRMWGVRSRYRVRAQASVEAAVVGHVHSQVIRFLKPYQPEIAPGPDGKPTAWYQVELPSGQLGHLAVKDQDRFAIDEVAQPQLCLGVENNQVKIQRYVGAGD